MAIGDYEWVRKYLGDDRRWSEFVEWVDANKPDHMGIDYLLSLADQYRAFAAGYGKGYEEGRMDGAEGA